MRRLPATLARDRRGATVIEFAMIAPVMVVLLLGLLDLTDQVYVQSVLDGAMQKAGRDSSLEANVENASALDEKVKAMVGSIAKNATYTSERKSYSTFALVKPENFTDGNNNGRRDPGECFDDVNNNGQWDTDPGRNNQGGANDVTKYTVTVTYPHITPVMKLLGWPEKVTLTSTTLLKNQPYKTQTVYTIPSVCT